MNERAWVMIVMKEGLIISLGRERKSELNSTLRRTRRIANNSRYKEPVRQVIENWQKEFLFASGSIFNDTNHQENSKIYCRKQVNASRAPSLNEKKESRIISGNSRNIK